MSRRIIPEAYNRSRLLDFINRYAGATRISFCAVSTTTPTGQAINHNTPTTVQFDTATINIGSGYDTTTDTFTAPYAGKYYFHANVLWQNIQSSIGYLSLGFSHNGTRRTVSFMNTPMDNNDEVTQSGGIMLDLSKEDTVVVFVKYFDSSEGTEHILGDGTNHYTQFIGYKL